MQAATIIYKLWIMHKVRTSIFMSYNEWCTYHVRVWGTRPVLLYACTDISYIFIHTSYIHTIIMYMAYPSIAQYYANIYAAEWAGLHRESNTNRRYSVYSQFYVATESVTWMTNKCRVTIFQNRARRKLESNTLYNRLQEKYQ